MRGYSCHVIPAGACVCMCLREREREREREQGPSYAFLSMLRSLMRTRGQTMRNAPLNCVEMHVQMC